MWKKGQLFIEHSKNGEGKMFPLIPELEKIIKEQMQATEKFQRENSAIVPHLFHNKGQPLAKRNQRGTIKVTKYFQQCWDAARSIQTSNHHP